MDTAKAVANDLGLKSTTLPIMASTDASTSTVSVIYTNKGVIETAVNTFSISDKNLYFQRRNAGQVKKGRFSNYKELHLKKIKISIE